MGLMGALTLVMICKAFLLWNAKGIRESSDLEPALEPPRSVAIRRYCAEAEVIPGGRVKCKKWTAEREALHQDIINQAKAGLEEMGLALEKAGLGARVFAFRGNSACGKSMAMVNLIPEFVYNSGLFDILINSSKLSTVNPDIYKERLLEAAESDFSGTQHDKIDVYGEQARVDDVFTDEDVFTEAMPIKEEVMNWAWAAKLGNNSMSFILDGRLGKPTDSDEVYKRSLDSKRRLTVFDIDCPLDVTLERILDRTVSDPLPDFRMVAAEGFVPARENRPGFWKLFKDETKQENLGRYMLISTAANLTQTLSYTIEDGEERTMGALPDATGARAEAEAKEHHIIDDTEIAAVCGQRTGRNGRDRRKCKQILEPWKNYTWPCALAQHADGRKPTAQKPEGC